MINIQILNLSDTVKDQDLKELFTPYGEIGFCEVAMDLFTEKSRGYGYVEMVDDEAAMKAIKALDQSNFHSNVISVKAAAPREIRRGSYKVGNGAVNVYRFRKN